MTVLGTTSGTPPVDLPAGLFTGIDHVGIAVADLDAALALYRDVYGMKVLHEETNAEQGVREAMVGFADAASESTSAPGSDLSSPAGPPACLQILAPLDENSTIAKFLDRSGPGLQQLAMRVTDVDEVSRVLRERGLRLLYDVPRTGTAGSRINFVHPKDAGGVLLELVEPAQPGTVHPADHPAEHPIGSPS